MKELRQNRQFFRPDVITLQDILGHTKLKTTMRYVKIVNAMRDRRIHTNPLAMLDNKKEVAVNKK